MESACFKRCDVRVRVLPRAGQLTRYRRESRGVQRFGTGRVRVSGGGAPREGCGVEEPSRAVSASSSVRALIAAIVVRAESGVCDWSSMPCSVRVGAVGPRRRQLVRFHVGAVGANHSIGILAVGRGHPAQAASLGSSGSFVLSVMRWRVRSTPSYPREDVSSLTDRCMTTNNPSPPRGEKRWWSLPPWRSRPVRDALTGVVALLAVMTCSWILRIRPPHPGPGRAGSTGAGSMSRQVGPLRSSPDGCWPCPLGPDQRVGAIRRAPNRVHVRLG